MTVDCAAHVGRYADATATATGQFRFEDVFVALALSQIDVFASYLNYADEDWELSIGPPFIANLISTGFKVMKGVTSRERVNEVATLHSFGDQPASFPVAQRLYEMADADADLKERLVSNLRMIEAAHLQA